MAAGGPPRLGRPIVTWLTSPYLLLTLCALFWSANMVVGRAARDVIPPIAFNFWRWTLALLILLPFTWRGLLRHRSLILRAWPLLTALALTGMTLFHSLIYLGLSLSPAVNGLLLFATSPLFFVLLAWLITGERITLGQGLGVLASIAGAALVIARGDLEALLGLRFAAGDLWLLAGVILWALYSVLLKLRPAGLPPLVLLSATVVMALVLLTAALRARALVRRPAAAGRSEPREPRLRGVVPLGARLHPLEPRSACRGRERGRRDPAADAGVRGAARRSPPG